MKHIAKLSQGRVNFFEEESLQRTSPAAFLQQARQSRNGSTMAVGAALLLSMLLTLWGSIPL